MEAILAEDQQQQGNFEAETRKKREAQGEAGQEGAGGNRERIRAGIERRVEEVKGLGGQGVRIDQI